MFQLGYEVCRIKAIKYCPRLHLWYFKYTMVSFSVIIFLILHPQNACVHKPSSVFRSECPWLLISVALECNYVKLSMFSKCPSSCSTSPGHGTLPSLEFKCISNFPYPVLLSHSKVIIKIHICALLFICFRWKPQSKILFVLALQSWHSFKGRHLRLSLLPCTSPTNFYR